MARFVLDHLLGLAAPLGEGDQLLPGKDVLVAVLEKKLGGSRLPDVRLGVNGRHDAAVAVEGLAAQLRDVKRGDVGKAAHPGHKHRRLQPVIDAHDYASDQRPEAHAHVPHPIMVHVIEGRQELDTPLHLAEAHRHCPDGILGRGQRGTPGRIAPGRVQEQGPDTLPCQLPSLR